MLEILTNRFTASRNNMRMLVLRIYKTSGCCRNEPMNAELGDHVTSLVLPSGFRWGGWEAVALTWVSGAVNSEQDGETQSRPFTR